MFHRRAKGATVAASPMASRTAPNAVRLTVGLTNGSPVIGCFRIWYKRKTLSGSATPLGGRKSRRSSIEKSATLTPMPRASVTTMVTESAGVRTIARQA
jgi:hypothetical protein